MLYILFYFYLNMEAEVRVNHRFSSIFNHNAVCYEF